MLFATEETPSMLFHGGFGVGLQSRPGHLAVESHLVAFHLIREVVKNGVPRQHDQLVPYFLREFLAILWFTALLLLFLRPSRQGV